MQWHRLFFYLLLALLPTQLGFHFWPEWSYVLGRRIDYLAPTLFLTDICVVVILFSWLIVTLKKVKSNSLFNKPSVITLLSISFIVFIGINIQSSTSPEVAVYKWMKMLEMGFLGLYIIKTKPEIVQSIFFLGIGVLYSSLIALGQFTLQHSIGGMFYWFGERGFSIETVGIARVVILGREYLRSYASFPHPNVLGGYLAVLLPILLYMFLNPKKLSSTWLGSLNIQTRALKYFYGITTVLGLLALIVTFSRSALVLGFIGLGLIGMQLKNVTIIIVLFIVVCVGSWFVLQSLHTKDESVVVRFQLTESAIKLWRSSPLTGVGLGNFLVRLPEALPQKAIYFLQPVHNLFLLVLAEAGLIGFLFFSYMLMVVLPIKNIYQVLLGNDAQRVKMLLYISCYMLLVFGLVDHWPLTLQQGQLTSVIVFSFAYIQRYRNSGDKNSLI